MSPARITVVTPSIPPRADLLRRASRSVAAQTERPVHVVTFDWTHEGAAVTRQRGLDSVSTPWVAFLDDDDEMDPGHLAMLLDFAQQTGSDYVYPWFRVHGGTDPFPQNYRRSWNPDRPVQTTITVLVRTDLAKSVGFLDRSASWSSPGDGQSIGEDFWFTLGCRDAGAVITHMPWRTWTWHHHDGNTSGRGDRW